MLSPYVGVKLQLSCPPDYSVPSLCPLACQPHSHHRSCIGPVKCFPPTILHDHISPHSGLHPTIASFNTVSRITLHNSESSSFLCHIFVLCFLSRLVFATLRNYLVYSCICFHSAYFFPPLHLAYKKYSTSNVYE